MVVVSISVFITASPSCLADWEAGKKPFECQLLGKIEGHFWANLEGWSRNKSCSLFQQLEF